MSEQLQQQLTEMLQRLLAAMEQGAAFAVDQVPPLIAEKILLGRLEETTYLVLWLLATGFITTSAVWGWRYASTTQDYGFYNGECFLGILPTVVSLAMLVFGVSRALGRVYLVWFAPRLYIVEWLRGMM